jgi:hypothetical protein
VTVTIRLGRRGEEADMIDKLPFENPWTASERAFPAGASDEDQLLYCLSYAVLAPSIHNTQPWLFRLRDGAVELLADRSRALPVVDPDDRLLTISCGAALMNLTVALHNFGREVWLQYLPDPDNLDLLARVRPGRTRLPDIQEQQLFRAIRQRRTTRLPFDSRPLPPDLPRRLIWLASEHNCWLHFIDAPDARARLVELVEEGNRRQFADPAFRQELASWIRSRGSASRDGLTPPSLGMNRVLDYTSPLVSLPVRTFDMGEGRAARDWELIDGSPMLVVIGTDRDDPESWINAGQALQAMLLRVAAEGITASFLNQPCEVDELRGGLRDLTGRTGYPQLVLRLGYGPPVWTSPRRPVSDVIVQNGTAP